MAKYIAKQVQPITVSIPVQSGLNKIEQKRARWFNYTFSQKVNEAWRCCDMPVHLAWHYANEYEDVRADRELVEMYELQAGYK